MSRAVLAAVIAVIVVSAVPALAQTTPTTTTTTGTSTTPTGTSTTPPPVPGWLPGWLADPTAFEGRYRLVSSIRWNGQKNVDENGELTVFIQPAFRGKPPAPAGIMALHPRHSLFVLYLTDLDHDGTTLESLVHGGAFLAPATGRFTVSEAAGGRIVGVLRQPGLATQTLTFRRFSKKPAP
jgi:hypothetical protein